MMQLNFLHLIIKMPTQRCFYMQQALASLVIMVDQVVPERCSQCDKLVENPWSYPEPNIMVCYYNSLATSAKPYSLISIQVWPPRSAQTDLGVPRHLYFIRHGDYFRNPKSDELQVLTSDGKKQANSVATFFEVRNITPTKIYYSNLQRSIETASIVSIHYPSIPTTCTPLLREVSLNDSYKIKVT